MQLAGLDVTPPDPIHGKSFAAHLRGQSTQTLRDYAITAAYMRSPDASIPDNATTPVVYTAEWAYVPIGPEGRQELYRLDGDYYAETNVIAEHRDVTAQLHDMLLEFLKNHDAPQEAVVFYERH